MMQPRPSSRQRFVRWNLVDTEKSTDDDLAEPLLELCDEDEENDPLASPTRNAVTTRGQLISCFDHVCLVLIMPLLLVVQFAMAQRRTPSTMDSDGSLGRVIGTVIVPFIVAAHLYKTSLPDSHWWHQWTSTTDSDTDTALIVMQVVLLAPEIVMDMALGVILFGSASAATTLLIVATMGMALVVIVSTLNNLLVGFEGTSAPSSTVATNATNASSPQEANDTPRYAARVV